MGEMIYLAAPWFNPAQAARYQEVLDILREWKEMGDRRSLYIPRDFLCPPDGTAETRRRVYRSNLENILIATKVVAITDEKDVGTIFELGYAAKLREEQEVLRVELEPRQHVVQLVGVALTLGDAPFNLMLAEGLDAVCKTLDELSHYLFHGTVPKYEGNIE